MFEKFEQNNLGQTEEPNKINKEIGKADSEKRMPDIIEPAKTEQEILKEKYKEVLEKNPRLGKEISLDKSRHPEAGREYDANQEISWDNIVFIRAEDKFPVQKEDELRISTPYETEEAPRMTSHWCLNHKVVSHLYGNWEGSPYTIISPGKKMISKNGNPENLNGVDTYWLHGIDLPENSIILCREGAEIPNLSPELSKKINILEIDPKEEKKVISMLLEKMGYTELIGGTHYMEFDKNIDTLTHKLALKENIESTGLHIGDWTQKLEEYLDSENIGTVDEFEDIFKQRGYGKLPGEIKDAVAEKMAKSFSTSYRKYYEEENYNLKNEISGTIKFVTSILNKEFKFNYYPRKIEKDSTGRDNYQYLSIVEAGLKEIAKFKQMEEEGVIQDSEKEIRQLLDGQRDFINRLPDQFWQTFLVSFYKQRYGTDSPKSDSLEKFKNSIMSPLGGRLKEFLGERYEAGKWNKLISLESVEKEIIKE